MTKPTLCLDFDGVIHSYASGWQGATNIPDPPVPGAIEFISRALDHFEVVIFSSRSGHPDGIYAMRKWLRAHWLEAGFPGDREVMVGWPKEKPAAFITIDDRALTFDGTWPRVKDLLAFQPWNKRGVSELEKHLERALKEVRCTRRISPYTLACLREMGKL